MSLLGCVIGSNFCVNNSSRNKECAVEKNKYNWSFTTYTFDILLITQTTHNCHHMMRPPVSLCVRMKDVHVPGLMTSTGAAPILDGRNKVLVSKMLYIYKRLCLLFSSSLGSLPQNCSKLFYFISYLIAVRPSILSKIFGMNSMAYHHL